MQKIVFDDNPEEGIIKNDNLSRNERVELRNLSKFPFCLIGKIISEFKEERVSKSGIGMLIGPSIVLTAGHNLTNISKETGKLETASNIKFIIEINEVLPFGVVSTSNYYIPESFTNGIKEQNAKKQLLNDWSVLFLNTPLGESIKKLYSLESFSYLNIRDNGLYLFFLENSNQNINKLASLNPEISIVGFTESSCEALLDKSKVCDYVNKEGSELKEKQDINISIQICAKEEGLMKAINSNSNNPFNMKLKPNLREKDEKKYLIFNSNKSNCTQLVKGYMSESLGKLEDFSDALKYKISTYKGQSGSPIFLKLKKMVPARNGSITSDNPFVDNLDISNNDKDHNEFIYVFLGIHSRRGPLLYENIFLKDADQIDEVEDEVDKVETKVKKLSIDSQSNSKPSPDSKYTNLVAMNGICDFNEGLLIMGSNVSPISEAAKLSKYEQQQKQPSTTDYKSISISVSSMDKTFGLFHKDTKLDILFDLGSQILSIDKQYVILSLIQKKSEKKFNSKFDNNKQIQQIIEEDQYVATFEAEVNMKYGDELGKQVLEKYMENYDLTLESIKQDFKQIHMKVIFDSIFDEISSFAEIHPTYGKLFSKIKSYVLGQLGLI